LASYGNQEAQRNLVAAHTKLREIADPEKEGVMGARQHYETALVIIRELRARDRLEPADRWMIEDLEARLAALSQYAEAR
jgi:hypothetical protein